MKFPYFSKMKNIFLFLFLLVGFYAKAQTDKLSLKSPVIVCKVEFGEKLGFGDYTVKFAEVLSDSRCPEKVTCVWAGEAKIRLEIQKNGEKVENKTLVFSPNMQSSVLFSLKNKEVKVYGLSPYPVEKPIRDDGKYVLKLILEGQQ